MERAAARVIATAAAGATLLVLAACSSSEKRGPACPSVLMLSEATTMTQFAPGRGTDLLDVDYQVEIADLLSGCEVSRRGKPGATMTVAVAPILIVSRGSANRDGQAAFAYFVSVIDPNDVIVNKQDFPVAVTFTTIATRRWCARTTRRSASISRSSPVRIPSITKSSSAATDREQLEFNRKRRVPPPLSRRDDARGGRCASLLLPTSRLGCSAQETVRQGGRNGWGYERG